MNKLIDFLDKNNISVAQNFVNRCEKYIDILLEWGAVHSLVSTNSLNKDTIIDNIIDSIYPLKFLNNFNNCLDVGSGAGYPGMILAFGVEKNIILCEPKEKRVAFLNFVKNILNLSNVNILHKRVENINNLKVDLITSRAVTNIDALLSMTTNLAKYETEFLFYKGSGIIDEIEKIKLKNYEIISFNNRNYLYIKRKDLFC